MRLTGPKVVVLAYDGLCTFEFGVAVEIFALSRPELGPNWFRFAVASVDRGPLRAAGGIRVAVDGGLGLLRSADIVVVPGWRGIDAPVPNALVKALRAAHARGARLMSLCSGVAVLAAAGVLDGRRATTHWRYVEALSVRYPNVTFAADVLYVDEGDVMTAAGSAAGIDLCLHLIRNDYGAEAANSVARRLVVPPHRDGGQAQFIVGPVPKTHESDRLGPLLDWMRGNLDRPLTIATLARRARMSARTLQRRVEETTGMAVGRWILAERLRAARGMLEGAQDTNLDDIAAACGFGTLANMRHHFRQHVRLSPSAYRQRFGRGAADAEGLETTAAPFARSKARRVGALVSRDARAGART
jgi:AraC family transcriptional activator FtrA